MLRAAPRLWLLCFFLSGVTGIVYQVAWQRMLGLVFGHTLHATATVLAAFMGGLGLGSFLLGERSSRLRSPQQAYGWLELGIGLLAAASPWLIDASTSTYISLHRQMGLSPEGTGFVAFALASLVLVAPATLMGGTLPLMTQALVRNDEDPASSVGVLYALNTAGAVLGAVLAGYGLLPLLGNRATIWSAAVVNVAIGVAMSRASTLAPSSGDGRKSETLLPEDAGTTGTSRIRIAVTSALAVSGAVAMAGEIGWTRALSQVIGSSTTVFTAVLTAFLLGIAGGAAIYARRIRRRPSAALFDFILLQLGAGLATLAMLAWFDRLPGLFLEVLRVASSPGVVVLAQFLISVTVLLPVTLFLGATFPCAIAAGGLDARHSASAVGRLYALNTLGSIAGCFATGFVLVPWIGLHSTLVAAGATSLLLACALAACATTWAQPAHRRPSAIALAAGVAGIAWGCLLPVWDLRLLSSAPSQYVQTYLAANTPLETQLEAREFVFLKDGTTSTVSVTRSGDALVLRTDGKAEASTEPLEIPPQAFLGHLPMLLHQGDVRRVLHIGLGGGVSAAAVLMHPIEHLDVVEIEAAVAEAARLFGPASESVFTDPRSTIRIADARNALLTSDARYDVIVSQPSHLWVSGVASLFSTEYFESARAHLETNGLMAQWVQTSILTEDDLKMVIRTFSAVFPDTTLWRTSGGQMLMIGQTSSAPIDLTVVKTRFASNPAIAAGLLRMGITGWAGVLGNFLLGGDDVARFCSGAGSNTDDLLPLEFSAARALYRQATVDAAQRIEDASTHPLPAVTDASRFELDRPENRQAIGVMLMSRGRKDKALSFLGPPVPILPR